MNKILIPEGGIPTEAENYMKLMQAADSLAKKQKSLVKKSKPKRGMRIRTMKKSMPKRVALGMNTGQPDSKVGFGMTVALITTVLAVVGMAAFVYMDAKYNQ